MCLSQDVRAGEPSGALDRFLDGDARGAPLALREVSLGIDTLCQRDDASVPLSSRGLGRQGGMRAGIGNATQPK